MTSLEVFWIFLRLGLTAFGGPIAHLGFFHQEFVQRRRWLDEHAYADLVSLCQILPGPASSQVGIAIGLSRAGFWGSVAAWLGFTLPSALLFVLLAFGLTSNQEMLSHSWIHGLKVAATAVVANAIWGMAVNLCPDKKRATVAFLAAGVSVLAPSALMQIAIILAGGIAGVYVLKIGGNSPDIPFNAKISKFSGLVSLMTLAGLLSVLPILAKSLPSHGLRMFDTFFRAGSLVFGGGHVILPLLKAEVVSANWLPPNIFMAGYGAAQALPGPLFSFSAYVGALSRTAPTGLAGAMICLLGAFLPSFLLVFGILPFWENIRDNKNVRFALTGVNAAVVGLLIAAFYDPVWTNAIFSVKDFSLLLLSFAALAIWKAPSWMVVILCAVVGGLWL